MFLLNKTIDTALRNVDIIEEASKYTDPWSNNTAYGEDISYNDIEDDYDWD
jgi:hypothetical protein